jgi:cyclopropane-fatty-acyl-phospholipid synthase
VTLSLRAPGGGGVADRLAGLLTTAVGGPLPVRLRAWDGSESGPRDAPVVVVRSRRALRRLLWQPGELGLAQAYVTGELDVEGDLAEGLRRVWAAFRQGGLRRPPARELTRSAGAALRLGAVGLPPRVPSSQANLRGRVHTRARDRDAIAHHYDLSNEFYALILDPQMAYSCAYWTSDDPSYTLQDAQRDKLELVSRKVGLQPGMRLLDVGCGWGSMVIHAAHEHGVRAVGVTLSAQQQAFVRARVAASGLEDLVEIRLQDYRDVDDGPYDAVTSLEMGEHVGQDNYPTYAAALHGQVRPGGKVLVQQMSRRGSHPGGGPFIEAFIAPDMHMRPVGETVSLLEDSGLELRGVEAMREHYVRTVEAWLVTFESRWSEAVALVGEEVARVWRLYLVGGALAFEEGRMGVDQILLQRRAD